MGHGFMDDIPKFGDTTIMQNLNNIIGDFQIEIIECTKRLKNKENDVTTRIKILHISSNLKEYQPQVYKILKYIESHNFVWKRKYQRFFCKDWLSSDIILFVAGRISHDKVEALLANENFQLLANKKYDNLAYHVDFSLAHAYNTHLSVYDDLVENGIGLMFGYVNAQQYSRLKIIDEWDEIERSVCNICMQLQIRCGRDIVCNATKLLKKIKYFDTVPLSIMDIIRSYRNILAHPLNNARAEEKFVAVANVLGDDLKSRINPEILSIDTHYSRARFVLVAVRLLKIWLYNLRRHLYSSHG